MVKVFFVAVVLLMTLPTLPAQVRLLVTGNTADARTEFYSALDARLRAPAPPATVLLAGDLIADCAAAEAGFPTLGPLLDLLRAHPTVTFYLIPGDRDWDRSGRNGLRCVRALEDHLRGQRLANLKWPLHKGCPGPVTVELSARLRLLLLNTQWWNHPFDKPVPADADCDFADPSIVLDEIVNALEENQDQNIVVAGHYPPKSQGRRGGSFPGRDHFLPPVLGSFRLSYRQNVGTPEELTNARFARLGRYLNDLNALYTGLIFVGAQDRSQQLLRYGRNYLVNAGAPGPGRWAAKHQPAMHVDRAAGFTEMTFAADGAVDYAYFAVGDTDEPLRRESLFSPPCAVLTGAAPANPAFPPCRMDATALRQYAPPTTSTVTVAPGPQYARSGFGETFLGQHYRSTWTTPVTVPLLDLAAITDTLLPVREGGGRQTTALKLRSRGGESYVFRSVDKDPAGTLNYEIRNTIIADAVRDQTSSGHPYGGLVVAPLAERLGLLHAEPRLYALAPGPLLGDFNAKFAYLLGTLEISPQGAGGGKQRPVTFGADEILKSFELLRARYDDQEVRIEYPEYLRARLLDLLIGDWSRHEDNWKWASFRRGKIEYVRPVPRDRDNAFSLMDGVFPWLASRRWAVPNLEHFGFGAPDLRSLTHQARHLDRLLLSPLDRSAFQTQAAAIRELLPDSVLEAAVREMPAPAYAAGGDELVAKLQRRRDDLNDYATEFYRLHARTVDVVGTNDEEAFLVEREPDGQTTVTVTDQKGISAGKVLYRRTFDPQETREIRLYGLGDDDAFTVTGPAGSAAPRLRLIGGAGADTYTGADGPGRRVPVYERESEVDGPGLRAVNNWRPELYYYDRTDFEYNTLVPVVGLGINSFNGVQLGIGATYTRRNFTRRAYSARYTVYAEGSTVGNGVLEGRAEFGQVLRRFDLVAEVRLGRPDFYNFFFGLGNGSVKNPELDRNRFYLVQLQHFSAAAGLRRQFAGRSAFTLTTGYQNNTAVGREGTILDRDDRLYGDGDLVFGYLQPEVRFDLRDSPQFPSKGVMLEASQKVAFGRGTPNFGVSRVAAEIHLSTRRFPISLSFRVGYADSQGDAPFYELPALGRDNGLRGFQPNRFVGDGYVFYNTEFRSPVALVRSRIAPFAIGIRAFYDRGKIIGPDETDKGMKNAYGGGLYLIPLKRDFTISLLAGFSEEESLILQFGAGTNF